jgi:hypothetical protein
MRSGNASLLNLSLLCIALAGCSKSERITAPAVGSPDARRTFSVGELNAAVLQSHTFTPGSTNPYFPLVPGTVFTYRSKTKDGTEIEVMRVTDQTKVIQGVTTRVVQDDVRLDGVLTEHTFDWFAQDELGNVWYFGEDSQSIDPETGEVSTEGSWQAGKAGAEAGIIMEAHPAVGDSYNEENAAPVAEDQARVTALGARAKVPYGRFDGCLETENTSPLEPTALENKFYASGVGLVLEVDVTEKTRNELVSITGPGGPERERGRGHRHGEDEVRAPEKHNDHHGGRADAE